MNDDITPKSIPDELWDRLDQIPANDYYTPTGVPEGISDELWDRLDQIPANDYYTPRAATSNHEEFTDLRARLSHLQDLLELLLAREPVVTPQPVPTAESEPTQQESPSQPGMALAHSGSLSRATRVSPLTDVDIASWVVDVAETLRELHDGGKPYTHRDVKPSNVFFFGHHGGTKPSHAFDNDHLVLLDHHGGQSSSVHAPDLISWMSSVPLLVMSSCTAQAARPGGLEARAARILHDNGFTQDEIVIVLRRSPADELLVNDVHSKKESVRGQVVGQGPWPDERIVKIVKSHRFYGGGSERCDEVTMMPDVVASPGPAMFGAASTMLATGGVHQFGAASAWLATAMQMEANVVATELLLASLDQEDGEPVSGTPAALND